MCFVWVDDKFEREELLGGPAMIDEIDECKIGKRKFNRGTLLEGTWVLGMIELNTGIDMEKRERRGDRYGLEICPDNKRAGRKH